MGLGYPNYNPPKQLLDAFETVSRNQTELQIHQYSDCRGVSELRTAVADLNSILMKRVINPNREVLITAGAMNALSLTAKTFINPGDEVIFFSPFFILYEKMIILERGISVSVPLRTPDGKPANESNELTFDRRELEMAFTNKTKMIWLNNPNNPTGKIFTEQELTFIGQLCEKHDVIILSDEVAQWYHFEGPPHIRTATLPGLWKRTLTVTSGGKLFGGTGWRIGWIIGPENLIWGPSVALNADVFSVPTLNQLAFAMGLRYEIQRLNTDESYFKTVVRQSQAKRDKVMTILHQLGVQSTKPNSGYFIMANFTNLIHKIDLTKSQESRPGHQLSIWMLNQKNLLTFPGTLFYDSKDKQQVKYILRICFIETDDTIDKFGQILQNVLAW